jgi:hypothetical protein
MTIAPTHLRRATLLGLALGIAACDVVAFVVDPKPILEQTWNLPADSSQISVASLLPAGVSIYSTPASNPPDSSAFQVAFSNVSFSRRVGDDCAACVPLNGQTTIKPPFVLTTGSAANMPLNVVSGTLIGGQVTLSITNGLSFDPLRVKTNAPASTDPTQQGRLVIVLRSGSLVVGRDSINGATTALAPGAVLNRTINLQPGNLGSALAVDLTLTSPQSDNNVPINSNGMMSATMGVPDLRIAVVRVNVVNRTLSNVGLDSIPLEGMEDVTKYVVGGGLDMTIINPFNVSGNVNVLFTYGPAQTITKSLTIVAGSGIRQFVTLDSTEMHNLFNAAQTVSFQVSGTVNSPGPVDLTPKQVLTLVNRLILKIHTPD